MDTEGMDTEGRDHPTGEPTGRSLTEWSRSGTQQGRQRSNDREEFG